MANPSTSLGATQSRDKSPTSRCTPKCASEPRRVPGAPPHVEWVVLKIAQRCNLNCSYCYVYNRGDDSWKRRPVFISEAVLTALARRITAACAESGSRRFVVELHGGEPLLIGKSRLQSLIGQLRLACPGIALEFHLQTNGVLLDEEWIDVFAREGVRIGISLDGPPEIADRYRVDHDGEGSTQAVLDTIARLRSCSAEFDHVFSGILCVINPDLDGAELVRWFVRRGIHAFDLLLPDGNYTNPPPGWTGAAPYRRFLLSAFGEYYAMGSAAPRIRTFELIIRAFMGVTPMLDALGGDLRRLCVVETNGAIGLSDVARMCGGVFAEDSLSVFSHGFSEVARHYNVEDLQRPCAACVACPAFRACGGGYLPHRFDGHGFDHPSIYCEALYALIEAVYARLREDIPRNMWVRV
jgi:uncharacterized protein